MLVLKGGTLSWLKWRAEDNWSGETSARRVRQGGDTLDLFFFFNLVNDNL